MSRRVLVGPLLIALLLPMARASAAPAGLRTIGCAKLGYAMLIPRDWTMHGACLPSVVALCDDTGILLVVKVTRTARWNDSRARTAIAQDIATGGAPIRFSYEVFNGRPFLLGAVTGLNRAGTPLQKSELDTFQSGYVYSFFAEVVLVEDPSATVERPGKGSRTALDQKIKCRTLVAAAWATINITRK